MNVRKIKGEDIISEIIQIFEKDSLVVKNILRIKKLLNFIIVIFIINIVIWILFKNILPIFDITIFLVTFIYFFYIFKYFFESVY